jgi:regulator of sigma E protease
LGGVTVNFILAFLIYIGIAFAYGELYINNSDVKDGVWVVNPVFEKIGLKTGDKIIAVDGVKGGKFNDLNEKIMLGKTIDVERNGMIQKINLPVNFIDQLTKSDKMSIVELRLPFVVTGVEATSLNKAAIQPKDIIINFNGKPITYADEVLAEVKNLKGKTVPAIVKRDEKEIPILLKISDSAKMGIGYTLRLPVDNIEKLGLYKINRQSYGFFESIPVGLQKGVDRLVGYGKQLKVIFSPETGAYKSVGGFYAIFNIFPAFWSWEVFWNITALLSIMLGVMNLLPIPALDGGHVMFLLYEMISGKKPSDKFLERAQMVGFFLLIGLVLFANGNDIYKAIVGK